ncbi:MAG: PilZ domain-containing protein [Deltaproteobacteria bacterium]|nr:PilZ domain-containing protein [Deltaproteobacteria bacterium]
MNPISMDRRRAARDTLTDSRRRFPRLSVALDAFYESDACTLTVSRLDLSLRGAFLPCALGDNVETEGILRIALPAGPMVRARVRVVRQNGVRGMALRFIDLSDSDRLRLGAFLVRQGGLQVIPALERRFGGWARLPNPLLRRELRGSPRRAS